MTKQTFVTLNGIDLRKAIECYINAYYPRKVKVVMVMDYLGVVGDEGVFRVEVEES